MKSFIQRELATVAREDPLLITFIVTLLTVALLWLSFALCC
jgi:hypothetical protein